MKLNTEDIILSSRIRLARNLNGYVFPHLLKPQQAKIIADSVFDAVKKEGNYRKFQISNLPAIKANLLKEEHLISNDCLESKLSQVIIDEKNEISIMCNEEDHVREQCILQGQQLQKAYNVINKIDNIIAENLPFCFSPQLGYLTSCITNVGTGLRASVMMFLPGLAITKSINKYIAAAAQLNLTIRGVYGEGTTSEGYIYQISNSKTLGISELNIIDNLEKTLEIFIEKEHNARQFLLVNNEDIIKDKVGRALGTLLYAYSISTEEFMSLLAFVKLGIYLNMIKASDKEKIDKLIIKCQPAHIADIYKRELDPEERDKVRAKIASKTLQECLSWQR